MTAAELGERMSAAELRDWIAFDAVNRPDSWYQTAMILREIHWAMGDVKQIEDFLPPVPTFEPEAPDPDLAVRIHAWATARNARFPANE